MTTNSPLLSVSPLSRSEDFIKNLINLDAVIIEANYATEAAYEYIESVHVSAVSGISTNLIHKSFQTATTTPVAGREEWRFWVNLEMEGQVSGYIAASGETLTYTAKLKMTVGAQVDFIGERPTLATLESYSTLERLSLHSAYIGYDGRGSLPAGTLEKIVDAKDIHKWLWMEELSAYIAEGREKCMLKTAPSGSNAEIPTAKG